jgi:VWFA-related protein
MSARAAAILLMCALGVATLAAGSVQFRGGVHVVELNVSVIAGKKPVLDLGPADFEVRDNRVEQRIVSVSRDVQPIDLTVAVDMSETQSRALIAQIERTIGRIRDHLKPTDRVSVLTFADRIRMLAALVPPDAAGVKLGQPSNWGTHTPLNDALGVMLAAAVPPDRRHLAVVFADGGDSGSVLSEADVLDLAGRSRAVVFAVTRTASSGWEMVSFPRAFIEHPERRPAAFFERLTALTGGRVSTAAAIEIVQPSPGTLTGHVNANLIDNAFTSAIEDFRSGYTVRYVLGGETAGWHDVAVTVRGHDDYRVRTRTGYRID